MTTKSHRGMLFVLVGPGGTGKNTLMYAILEHHPEIKQLATATTRKMRPNEQQGREHLFVSLERFKEMIENDELLEHQEVTPGSFYGIPRATVDDAIETGQFLIADIEVLGAKILQENYPKDTQLIFVTVPGDTLDAKLDVLKRRMQGRHDAHQTEADAARIQQRLDRARQLEFPFAAHCDDILINDHLEVAVGELDDIISRKIAQRTEETNQETNKEDA